MAVVAVAQVVSHRDLVQKKVEVAQVVEGGCSHSSSVLALQAVHNLPMDYDKLAQRCGCILGEHADFEELERRGLAGWLEVVEIADSVGVLQMSLFHP